MDQQPGGEVQLPGSIPDNDVQEKLLPTVASVATPSGLESFIQLERLFVKQSREWTEFLVGFETDNKYSVKSEVGNDLFLAVEESGCCARNCCGPYRSFHLKILDMDKNEIIRLSRPLRCTHCCFPCCLQSIEVCLPDDTVIGSVEQEWTFWRPAFRVKNESGDVVLKIVGPLCTFTRSCGRTADFRIMSWDGETEVGKISKHWSGLGPELLTDTDLFGISFPVDLDIRMKAVMMSACFLIDFMFFESNEPGVVCQLAKIFA